MLSAKEIVEYVRGPAKLQEEKQFTLTEAKQIGDDLGIRWETFDVEQFAMGLNVEMEHGRKNPQTDVTNDEPTLTGKIALAHLNEIPDYYTRLAVMEDEGEQAKSPQRRRKGVLAL